MNDQEEIGRQMNETDYMDLPQQTCEYVLRLESLGMDRQRIHGLFVLLGLHSGTPDTQENIESMFIRMGAAIPVDLTRNIDEVVGHLYDGYDREINEFCYRSGFDFKFRELTVPNSDKVFHIINPKDESLLNTQIRSIEKLADASRLHDAFLNALGRSTSDKGARLLDAFFCGAFQMQLYAQLDADGSRQVSAIFSTSLPLFYGNAFNSIISGNLQYFLKLETNQDCLHSLMGGMESNYAQQMWAFQPSLFFEASRSIPGIRELDLPAWHDWVLGKAREFDCRYRTQLLPLSKSGLSLPQLPNWSGEIEDFACCDEFIHTVWGYSANSLDSEIEALEYRALVVHLVYSSLTSSREQIH